jgi:HK97 family phage prohead protease
MSAPTAGLHFNRVCARVGRVVISNRNLKMRNYDIGAMTELEEKALGETEDAHVLTGYASTFGNTDRVRDIMMPGAFAKSLREEGLPLLLFNHRMSEDPPIGTVVDAKEDRRGLWFKAELPKDDDFVAKRIVPQIRRKGLKGVSIGYKATTTERRKSDGVRLLHEVKLYEISLVNLAANPEATISNLKGLIPFQGLPVDMKAEQWDAEAALARIKARFGDDEDAMKQAFIFDSGAFDTKFLIADVDDDGRLVANHIALYKSAASVSNGVSLTDEAQDAVKEHLDRYYAKLGLESPFKSFSVAEFEALTDRERDARLRGLGVSRELSKKLMDALGQRDADLPKGGTTGQRDADRNDPGLRDAGPAEDALALLKAFAEIGRVAVGTASSRSVKRN